MLGFWSKGEQNGANGGVGDVLVLLRVSRGAVCHVNDFNLICRQGQRRGILCSPCHRRTISKAVKARAAVHEFGAQLPSGTEAAAALIASDRMVILVPEG
jgi:hypothetical protein